MDTSAQRQKRPSKSKASVQAFLDDFARALTAGDGKAIAQMWQKPAYLLGDEMVKALDSYSEIAIFFGGAKDQYPKHGITSTRAEIIYLQWITNGIALVTVRWPYLDEDDHEHGAETSTYTLRRNEMGDIKICVAMMHGVEKKKVSH